MYDGVRTAAHLPRRAHERLSLLQTALVCGEAELDSAFIPNASASDDARREQVIADHFASLATAMAVGLVASTARETSSLPTLVANAPTPEEAVAEAELLAAVRQAIDELPHAEAPLSKSWASRLHKMGVARLTKRLRTSLSTGDHSR
jgi:hypothetical protein